MWISKKERHFWTILSWLSKKWERMSCHYPFIKLGPWDLGQSQHNEVVKKKKFARPFSWLYFVLKIWYYPSLEKLIYDCIDFFPKSLQVIFLVALFVMMNYNFTYLKWINASSGILISLVCKRAQKMMKFPKKDSSIRNEMIKINILPVTLYYLKKINKMQLWTKSNLNKNMILSFTLLHM